MNKEIEEMAKDINKRIACCGYVEDCKPIELAEKLYNADYRKTVWHKVADGDLPKEDKKLLWVYYKDFFDKSFYYGLSAYENKQFDYVDVIAWMELPKYKGEEQ